MKFLVNLQKNVSKLIYKKNFKSSKKLRILYQMYTTSGAFKYIDQGFVNGYKAVGADVITWNAKTNQPDIFKILAQFKPTHFIGFMQELDRSFSLWMTGDIFKTLLRYKWDTNLHVAVRSNPSNIRALFKDLSMDFSRFPEAGVSSFYLQPDRPNDVEKKVFTSGFVDIIRSAICHKVYEVCFRNYLDMGLPILEEPHAADVTVYKRQNIPETIDAIYIGGCWPFKWVNMEPYVVALKKNFADGFKIYGRGWPKGFSEGLLSEEAYNKMVSSAKVNIALHEPSQVLSFPFAGNERIFKLLAMQSFIIADPNPLLNIFFRAGEEIVVAKNPAEMAELTAYYVKQRNQAEKIAHRGYEKVLAKHTYKTRAERLIETVCTKSEQIITYSREVADEFTT